MAQASVDRLDCPCGGPCRWLTILGISWTACGPYARSHAEFPARSPSSAPTHLPSPGRPVEVPHKASRTEFGEVATIGARKNRGDLVWVSWVPGDRKGSPGHGSTLLMLTPRGAAKLLLRMPTATDQAALEAADRAMEAGIPPTQALAPGHFDLSLLASLRDDGGHRMQASYLMPPCGSYSVHPSSCDKQFGGPEERPNGWGQSWGTRGRHRLFAKAASAGHHGPGAVGAAARGRGDMHA